MIGLPLAMAFALLLAGTAPPAPTAVAPDTTSGTSRALVVGINRYVPARGTPVATTADRAWADLDGAVNDATIIAELLVAKFGFARDHVTLLTNAAATREAIVAGLEALAASARPGDRVVFYFAGHGSQVRNSLASDEPDGLDESLVPADGNTGAADLRDKELAVLLGAILDRTPHLTVILDSCHSGSGARGLGKARHVAADLRDVADARHPSAPEQRGALVLSAAQDHQLAWETTDEAGAPHGVFSLALQRALIQLAPGESAEALFERVRVMMQALAAYQEPVLAGLPERVSSPLFGARARGRGGLVIAGLVQRPAAHDAYVKLQGGLAIGLQVGSELTRIGPGAPVRVRVSEVGLATATAILIEGAAPSLQATLGDTFEVVAWGRSPTPALAYYLPASPPTHAALLALAPELARLAASPNVELLDDPTAGPIRTHLVIFEEDRWRLFGPTATMPPLDLGPDLTAAAVLAGIAADPGPTPRARLVVALPPPRELVTALNADTRRPDALAPSPTLAGAQYVLSGRLADRQPGRPRPPHLELAWTTRDHFAMPLPITSLPPRSDWVELRAGRRGLDVTPAATRLDAQLATLGRVRGWLTLASPGDPGGFPYQLAFRRGPPDGPLHIALPHPGALVEGERWQLMLTRTPGANAAPATIASRYVYVLVIDQSGAGTLLFPPPGQGNVENLVPRPGEPAPDLVPLTDIDILPPLGLDTYLLLTTQEPLPSLARLGWDGIARATRGPDVAPLEALLGDIASTTRGNGRPIAAAWSIRQRAVPSVPRPR